LHIKDSEFFHEIYAPTGNKRRHKNAKWAAAGGTPTSTATTVGHDLHRTRRATVNPFFAKRAVVDLEVQISEKVDYLCERLAAFAESGEPIRLDVAYSALTTDVITEYCFGHTYNYLQEPDFKAGWKDAMAVVFEGSAFRRATPWLTDLMQKFPDKYILKMAPQLGAMIDFQNEVKSEADRSFGLWKAGKSIEGSIFSELLQSHLVPDGDRSIPHLIDEGTTIVAAGVETTAKALAITTFYVLSTPGVLQKLRGELLKAMPSPHDRPTWTQLEQLPYLSAVIQEGIRLAYGVTTRSPRECDEPIQYKEWVIPPRVCSHISKFRTCCLQA
jgi:cytochrome P450